MVQLGAPPGDLRKEIENLSQLEALRSCENEVMECVSEQISDFIAKMLPVEYDAVEFEPSISNDVLELHGLELLASKCNADNARGIAKALRRGNSLRTVLENTATIRCSCACP